MVENLSARDQIIGVIWEEQEIIRKKDGSFCSSAAFQFVQILSFAIRAYAIGSVALGS